MTEDNHEGRLIEVLTSRELVDVIERHQRGGEDEEDSEIPSVADRYGEYRDELLAERFVMPVAGVQGCGKSTMLNALLFERPVLRIDADETTCVPAEVRYSESDVGEARVRFKDGTERTLPADEQHLQEFIHNEHNSGNRLGVDRIILHSASPLLRNGMVLVDLPGMGSLTRANLETTQAYLREAVGVAFLLRTVPPLTASESGFVASTWARLPLARFVQNRWSDETDSEAKAGREFNEGVLRDIAGAHRIDIDGPPNIHVVNAFGAWRGVLQCDAGSIERSGLAALRSSLEALGESWPGQLRDSVRAALLSDVDDAADIVSKQIDDLDEDAETVKANVEAQQHMFDKYMGDLDDRRAEAQQEAREFSRETSRFLDRWAKDARARLRNEMRTKMRAGIVDGPRLTRALKDEQDGPLDDVYGGFQERALTFVDEINESFEGVVAWRYSRRDSRRTVHRKESRKLESLLPRVAGVVAGIGGAKAGGVTGAKIGAAIGSAGGPPGMIIGGIVGVIGGAVLGSWLGKKARDGVTAVRANNAWPEVRGAIDAFVDGTRVDLKGDLKRVTRDVERGLASWQKIQHDRYARNRDQRIHNVTAEAEEKQAAKTQLQRHADVLAAARKALEDA